LASSASSTTAKARIDQLSQVDAESIVEDLRIGKPPRRFVSLYAVGNEELLDGIRKRHLESAATRGKIRFVSGNWGRGKTHFLRLLREAAFDSRSLVSNVEISADSTPFNKFEQIFFEIIRNITSPEMYAEGDLNKAAAFGEVLKRALFGDRPAGQDGWVSGEQFQDARDRLMADETIDIDFRRMVLHYWRTFLPEGADSATLQDTRGRVIQWFAGEGTLGGYRADFGVQKIVSRVNARFMLESLSRFARHIGYRGVVVLLDEAEMSYSSMRKSNLKQAHNNLLYLINSIEESEGLLLIYAATPDFFVDPNHGIYRYGALAQRIGQPENRPPRALDRVWNLDAIETSEVDYLEAVSRIRAIYLKAYPEAEGTLGEAELLDRIRSVISVHPEYSTVSTWRVVVQSATAMLDARLEGQPLDTPEAVHEDIMSKIRNE